MGTLGRHVVSSACLQTLTEGAEHGKIIEWNGKNSEDQAAYR